MPAVFQGLSAAGDKDANLATMRRCATAASVAGSDLVVFPELFLTGYNLGSRLHDLAERRDAAGGSLATAAEIARSTGIGLVFGYPERDGADVFNSVVAIDRSGALAGHYRKIHLFGPTERALFRPGEHLVVADLAPFRVGLAICYDIEFPEMARALARAGATLIAAPTANMLPFTQIPTTLVRARALENAVAVAYANLAGQETDLVYAGASAIVGPDGRDIARAGPSGEMLLCCQSISAQRSAFDPALLSTQIADLRETPGNRDGSHRRDRPIHDT